MGVITNKDEAIKYIQELYCQLRECQEEFSKDMGQSMYIRNEMSDLYDEMKELKKISPELMKDKSIVMEALKTGCFNFANADKSLFKDVDVCLQAIKYDSYITDAFGSISIELRNDKSFMNKAILINPKTIVYVGDKLKKDQDFLDQAIFSIYYSVSTAKKMQEQKVNNITYEEEAEYSGISYK